MSIFVELHVSSDVLMSYTQIYCTLHLANKGLMFFFYEFVCRCEKFKRVATDPNILGVVNFQDLMTIGRPEQHLHINGLLSRGVQAGNKNAEYTMAKVHI